MTEAQATDMLSKLDSLISNTSGMARIESYLAILFLIGIACMISLIVCAWGNAR